MTMVAKGASKKHNEYYMKEMENINGMKVGP
jgi:hypothetical protein